VNAVFGARRAMFQNLALRTDVMVLGRIKGEGLTGKQAVGLVLPIADDMVQVMRLIRESHRYPGDLGLEEEITAVWRLWGGGKAATGPDAQRL
jgi:hypothetical protein